MGPLTLQASADWLVTFAIHSTCCLAVATAISFALGNRWSVWQERLLRFSLWAALASTSLQCAFATTPLPLSLRADIAGGNEGGTALPLPVDAPGLEATTPTWSAFLAGWSSAELLISIALALAAVGGLWLLRNQFRLRHVLRSREPETDGRTLAIAADVARSLGLRQSPHVSQSIEIVTPIAFGCVRPEICLPLQARTLDDAELRAMLAHEVAHLRRRDPVWMWFAAGLNALFPWQPLFAVARRRWSHLVELRCDAIAAGESSPTAVARCLLDVADWLKPDYRVPAAALGMAARPSALRQRVEAALHETATGQPHRGWSLGFGGVSLSALTFVAPGVDSAVVVHEPMVEFVAPVVAGSVANPGSVAALRAGVAMLERERDALLSDLEQLRAEARRSPRGREIEPILLLVAQRLDGVEEMCRSLNVLIDRREARESPFKSR